MTSKNIIPVALLTVASFGFGIILGPRLHRAKMAVGSSTHTSLMATNPARSASVYAALDFSETNTSNATALGHFSTLSEIEKAVQDAARSGRSQRYKVLSDIVQSVDPAQIPQVISFIQKLPANYRLQLRSMLLVRWGEIDPRAAMEYAGGVSRRPARVGGQRCLISGRLG